ncbi:helix-turn-helix domain-containing protein [Streptomyces sp. NPDC058451]|uniref:helix-turn-helix domain-containing protein n=1 Tax=Streptomyces sp. NPDC058451 TaxID=3346506 RepID=UPI00364C995E
MSAQITPLPGQGKKSRSAPHPLARTVGALMKQYRDEKGWTQSDALAHVPEMGSVPTLSRYETGKQEQDPARVDVFLRACGAPDTVLEEAARCLQSMKDSPQWANPSDVVSEPLAGLFALEATSKVIRTYQEAGIPGMLQTRRHARALMIDLAEAQPTEERRLTYRKMVSRRLDIRLLRQTLLDEADDRDDALIFEAVLWQGVLDMEVGGPAVHLEQLMHLLSLAATRPNIHIRILPQKALHHGVALNPSMMLLKPHEDTVGRAIYLETRNRSGDLLVDDEQVEMYQASLEDLWTRALSKNESMELLEQHIKRLLKSLRDERAGD